MFLSEFFEIDVVWNSALSFYQKMLPEGEPQSPGIQNMEKQVSFINAWVTLPLVSTIKIQ